ncbi:Ig-like domain-containing protein [Stigmatella sp. ncwal1]|uniref:Ig-like domain-containing protein n=1 Tax=Stigmatella ashevillensis TaxID=2995309 RepID=A0ABT5DKK8_9BACT|nr:Ig-like domain-containing protein [Stigmatella ashevillena]MDC0714124.1 Ig-like domain-containing protein [Stigmatella ashevillena]
MRNLLRTALMAVLVGALPTWAAQDLFGIGTGRDGALSIGTNNQIINRYARVRAPLATGDTTIPITATSGWSAGAGDLVMVLQTTGIVPEPTSGGGPATIDLSDDLVGRWELARVTAVTGTTLTLEEPLSNSYAANVSQVIRVPEYTTVTISASGNITARAWDGNNSTGGVVAFLAQGLVTNSGSITVTSRGFRGGQAAKDTTTTTDCSELDQPGPAGAQRGESIAQTRFGSTGRGRMLNGGGGGVCLRSGGGGGGNGGPGGRGGNSEDGREVGGEGGAALVFPPLSRLTQGGGAGAGHVKNTSTIAGGTGGGIIFIRSAGLSGNGSILADGFYASNSLMDGAGGGGGGGSIHLRFTAKADCSFTRVHAYGGDGANTNYPLGPGGGGGGGHIVIQSCDGSCVPPPSSVSGGLPGLQLSVEDYYGAEPGAEGVLSLIPGCYSPVPTPVVVTPAHNSRTNDTTPTYSGTIPDSAPGTEVVIYVDGLEVGRTTPDASGNWSFTPTTPLPPGTHTVNARADSDGLLGPVSNTNTFVVDTTPPAAPVVSTPVHNTTITDSTPTYSGTAEPFSTVTIIVDGVPVGTTTTNSSGAWVFTPTVPLLDGPHSVKATATDPAGNTSPDSNTNTFILDTTPPAAPVVITPANGSITSDNTPTYSGTAEAGSTVTIIVDGSTVGTTTASASGTWSFTPTTPLLDGSHSVRATASDAAGNASAPSNTNTFIVDTTPPAAPVVITPANGSTTQDNTPTYSGTAEAGSTVTVIVDGIPVGTTTANTSGAWSFTPTVPLADGSHTVKATSTDAAGNLSPESNTNTFTVDTTPPATPVVITPANGSTTQDNTPTYSGTADAGSTVTIIVDGVPVGTTTASTGGSWSFTPTAPLLDGSHTVKATATDGVGNTSPESNTNTFIVDTTAPAAPVVVTPANGAVLTDNTPTYSGTAEAGATVTLIVDGAPVGTTTANTSGAWSFTPAVPLADGSHSVKATATDAAGNTSPESNTNTFIIDTTAPAAPVVVTPANGSTTQDTTPTYSGTAEANSTVTVIVDGTSVGTTTASASGSWSFTPTTPLADGSHTVRATATDAVGNTSAPSNTNTFIVDTTAPAAPVVVTPANGSTTQDTTPTYSGTAEANSTVTVIVDGVPVGTTTASASGSWSFTPTAPLLDGSHSVSATATDAAGNASAPSNTNTFIVDTTAPAAPVVVTPANGSTTQDTTPTYSGTAEAGSTVTIIVDGTPVGTTTANAGGSWSFTPTAPLLDGSHSVRATATDAVGNTSTPSNTNTFIVDTTAPAAPVVITPANGSTTQDTTPTYSGTAEAGSTVTVIVDGTPVGTTTASASGSWSFTPTAPLADGSHTVRATATDAVGNTSAPSNTNTFIVDTTAPAAPVVVTPANGSTTQDTTPTYSGTAEAGSTVTVIVDGTPVGTTTANGSGSWSFTPTAPLADGPHTVKASATDAVGNTGPESNTNAFIVDTTAPAAPVVITPANGSTTQDTTPTYSGTAEAGSTVTVIVDGVPIGTTTASASGSWSFTPTAPLLDGSHTVRATATDVAGNTSAPSNTNTFIVDTTAPAAPVVVTPANGSTTQDTTPTYSGTAEAGSTVTVIVDGTPVGTTTASASGSWSFTPTAPLLDGSHSVRATATDAVGNTSAPSNTNTFIVDTTAPAAPVVITPANGSTTQDTTPTYSGTAEANSTVTVIVDGVPVGTTTANGSGSWSFTPTAPLADGSHTVKASATDAVGNTGPESNTNTFIVDTTAPAAPVVVTPANGSTTQDTTPTYSGTAEAGSTVTVIVDGTPVGTTTASASGSWSFTPTAPLLDGSHSVRATATDVAGNTSAPSNTNTFIVDTTAPAAPVVVTPANGSTTQDTTPTYSGTAEAGSTVTVIVDGVPIGTTTANASGAWSFTPTAPLADGSHTVKATATDAVGNTSPESNTHTFIIDTTAPAAPVVIAPSHGATISDNTPTYSGTAEAGATVTVIVDGTPVGTATANTSGTWSFTPTVPLADGSHSVKATATDAVGNLSPESNTNTFIVDTTASDSPVVTTPANGALLSDTTPTYSGTAEAGVSVTVIVDGITVGTTTASASGAWSFTPSAPLLDGSHSVKATATDAVGNTSPESNTNIFIIDTTAPAAPVVTTPANGATLTDNTPTYSGTAEAGATVTVIVDGSAVGSATANTSGAWSFTPTVPLPDGSHTVKATSVDAAGNASPESNTNTFIIDTTAPAAPVVTTPANGATLTDTTPTYSGTAEAGATVTVIVDGIPVGTLPADASGAWSFTPTVPLLDGAHTVKATATDSVGNLSPESNTNTFIIDNTAPAAPVVLTPADGSTIGDNTPTYSGTAEAGATVTVIVDGVPIGTTTASASGAWSFTPTVGLSADTHQVKATATDSVGHLSPESNTNTFIVDTTVPTAPVVVTPEHLSVTQDTTPVFTGTADANITVTLYLGTTELGSTTADATGAWSFTPTTPLQQGTYNVSAVATTAAGNASPSSNINTFTIDTTPPQAPVVTSPADGTVTSDNTPAISGTAEPLSTVEVTLNGEVLGTASTDAEGRWTITPPSPLPDGPYTVTATASDLAGNVSESSAPVGFVVDTAAPDTTIVSGPSGDTFETDASFKFSSSEPDVTYECSLDNAAFVPCSEAPTFPGLALGSHTLQVRARDRAGNVDPTPASATWNVQAPPVPPSDWAILGGGCASTRGGPASLAMIGLALSAVLARKRRR